MQHRDPAAIKELIRGSSGLGQLGDGASQDPYHSSRIQAIDRDMLTPFLKQDSGTFILVLGFVGSDKSGEQQKLFQQLLQGVDEHHAARPNSKLAAKQGLPELLNYIRHQAALGQPFTRQALQAGGFPEHQIGQLTRSGCESCLKKRIPIATIFSFCNWTYTF